MTWKSWRTGGGAIGKHKKTRFLLKGRREEGSTRFTPRLLKLKKKRKKSRAPVKREKIKAMSRSREFPIQWLAANISFGRIGKGPSPPE